jgi:hypothetical protein
MNAMAFQINEAEPARKQHLPKGHLKPLGGVGAHQQVTTMGGPNQEGEKE